ncbi:MAG: class I adenylate-forming enzyme family protein [Candidatus Andeanibacterium colombiense]|uniref:Class I adenylate-forming enzyme family protein n=1 Tax=Candidatus Andeanibacterium colombiense TaxID=3121345 RepID=A0AAJ5X9X2_9SPHN|nr:MAG: class I adenylate-forming enzyme family protein [Sphingomonadaceae bacterium]
MAILQPIYTHPPERVAARVGAELITYGRLCADIDSMAHWLLGEGLRPGDRVTLHPQVLANPCYWDWILHLGAMRAGLVQSTGHMPPKIAASGAIGPYAAAIGKVDKLAPRARPALRMKFEPQGSMPLAERIRIDGNRPLDGLETQAARLLATSGTTGQPKVVVWDAPLLGGRLEQVRAIGDLTPDTTLLTLLGLITTTGLRYPLAAWQIGATVLLASFGTETPDYAALVAPSTFLAASPFRMQDILRAVPRTWPGRTTRTIELFGGRVPPLLRDEVLKRCCSALRMSYGATEIGRVAAGDTALVDRHPGAVGMVEPGIAVEIVDADGALRPPGEPGIVRMKSDFMVGGYIGQLQGPRSPFRDGWFYPGDLGIVFDDGLFAITGRMSETINVSGAKYSPVVLEERLSRDPSIRDCCVVSVQLDSTDLLAVAVVCPQGTDLPSLRKRMEKQLPKHITFALISVPSIPRNAMGRIPRAGVAKKLAALLKDRAADSRIAR